MREILFRGKRTDGKWVYGYLSKSRHMSERPAILKPCIDYEEDGVMYIDYVMSETVGQYTGLKDKNGKKIFTGDIVTGAWDKKLTVYFDSDYLQIRAKEIGSSLTNSLDYYGIDKIEVIGNIHDNPELLEVQK